MILGKMASGKVTLDDVAPDLGMSTRSLSRKLAALELTYSDVLSILRTALATRYLQDSDLSVTEIAFLLGYADGSSFGAAVR